MAIGNTTAEGSRQFVYDQNQRLIRVTDAGVTKGEYTYNGIGQRVKKVAAGVVTIFHFSQNGQIIAESNGTGTIIAEYVYLNGQPLAKLEGANTYYYHNDHLATPQKMTDSTGTVVWSAGYKPFGEATITVSTITNNLRFPGQYYDAETGLNYNYYRDYNPVIGRYIEADPLYFGIVLMTSSRLGVSSHLLKLAGRRDFTLYQYVRNNPVNRKDTKGLMEGGPDTDGVGDPLLEGFTFKHTTPGWCYKCNAEKIAQCLALAYDQEQVNMCNKVCEFAAQLGPYSRAAKLACVLCAAAVAAITSDCIEEGCRRERCQKCPL